MEGGCLAAKELINNRRTQILKYLSKNNSYSIDELAQLTGVKKRTVLTDISFLRKGGNRIDIEKGMVTLKRKTDVVSHSSKSVMRKIRIITLINKNKGATKKSLFQIIRDSIGYYDDDKERKRKIDAERKNFDHDLEALLAEKVICMEGDQYYTSISAPEVVQLEDKELLNIYDMLINNGDKAPYSLLLYRIAEKIEEVLQYKLYEEPKKYVKSVLLRDNRENIQKYEDIMNIMFGLPFKTKKLNVQAVNRYGNAYSKVIAVEKIVYLCHSGKLYLMGEEHGFQRRSIIEFSRITNIESTDLKNTKYDNPQINRICEEMLNVSVDDLHTIVIKFDDIQDIRDSIARYMRERSHADVSCRDGKLIYTDKIRGIDDMAKMIRQYGRSCEVIEDDLLKNKVIESAKKIIERYECDE